MRGRTFRTGLGALAATFAVGVLVAPAASAAEEELSPEAQAVLEAIEEESAGTLAALEELSDEDREAVIHHIEVVSQENGTELYDSHCVGILLEGGSVDQCHQAPNQLVPEKNELIWGAIGFVVVFAFLSKVGYPAMKKSMAARSDKIRDDLESAESAKADASRVLDEYRAQLADAKAEAGRIIEEARQESDTLRRNAETALQTDLAASRERAVADAETIRAQALADLQGQVGALVSEGVNRVVVGGIDPATQSRLVDDYIAGLNARNN